ncbi:MoaD/ThiS family protein [Methanobacterium sp. BAmetb5]|uniref:MoaD/ThiS family protein n=1 Tax=Methanobacterium sp. BAmetb5 TaxID=2025351 RepID=UPI000E898459|nr:MoaD/ThiS family protein [Methanobacterium sp. BAmetb5]AXV40671.1 MAG: thiamine biosynthesis protein ThiS [Methanobacterium sp. BAmetb5]
MEVTVIIGEDEKKIDVEGDKTVKELLQMMEIPVETVVVKKNQSIIIEEELVENGDVIEVIKVIYGG